MYIFLFLWICRQHCFYILCDQTQQQMHISMSKLEFPVSFDMFPEKSSTCQEIQSFCLADYKYIKKLAWKFSVFKFWHVSVDVHFYIHTIFFFVMNENDVRKTHMIDSSIQKQSHEQKKILQIPMP